jgi:hypothetical protein
MQSISECSENLCRALAKIGLLNNPVLDNIHWLSGRLLLSSVLLGPVTPAQLGGAHTDAVISALKEKNYGDALHITQAALTHFPDSPQLWTLRALALSG